MSRTNQIPVPNPDPSRGLHQLLLAQSAQKVADILDAHGIVVSQQMSVKDAVALQGVGGTDYQPLKLLFGPGTWYFDANGLTISRNDIHIISLSPGDTIFRRAKIRARPLTTSSAPMVTLAGNDCVLYGVRFEDELDNNEAVRVTGDRCWVERCRFQSCWRAVKADGGDDLRLIQNYLHTDTRDTSYGIYLTGSAVRAVVAHNTCVSGTPGTFIRADDNVDETSFVGNIHRSSATYVVDYLRTGTENDAAANIPRSKVNAR